MAAAAVAELVIQQHRRGALANQNPAKLPHRPFSAGELATNVGAEPSKGFTDEELYRVLIARPGYIWLTADGRAFEKTGDVRQLSPGEWYFCDRRGPVQVASMADMRVCAVWREVDAELILERTR